MSMVEAEPSAWTSVAEAVNARLREFGWDQADLVRKSGVSDATVRNLQRGEQNRYRRSSLRKISLALLWPPDALERLAKGSTVEALERQMAEDAEASHRDMWSAAGPRIAARRQDLGLSPEELAALSLVGPDVIRDLEAGSRTSYTPGVLGRVAAVLDWPADAIHQLVLGRSEPVVEGEPRLIETVTSARLSAIEERLMALEDQVRGLLEARGLSAD